MSVERNKLVDKMKIKVIDPEAYVDASTFIVDKLVAHRDNPVKGREYLVRWSGYSSDADEWVEQKNITFAAIKIYLDSVKAKLPSKTFKCLDVQVLEEDELQSLEKEKKANKKDTQGMQGNKSDAELTISTTKRPTDGQKQSRGIQKVKKIKKIVSKIS